MTRNQLKELWFTIPREKEKKEMRAIVVQNGTVKVITDVNGYYSSSESYQGENSLNYALGFKSKEYYKEYQLIIK